MLWQRETESAAFDTPERRAGLEARIYEVVRTIGDDAVRRYYTQDFNARLRQLLAPPATPERNGRPSFAGRARQGAFRDGGRGGSGPWQRGRDPRAREPTPQSSARLSGSPIVRGFRSALPPREALILMAAVNHPWLLEQHAEQFAELEFLNPDADQLRRDDLGGHHR